jgi:uncharacterized protein (TIGR03663 family)
MLIMLCLALVKQLGAPAAFFAAALTAFSPAMVFYSSYYIQEMLLVFFSFALVLSVYHCFASGRLACALLAGLSAGLALASKETVVLAFAAMLISVFLTMLCLKDFSVLKKAKPFTALVFVLALLISAGLFYSSFFKNPRGILDALLTYKTYFVRGTGNSLHIHPWYYYLSNLFGIKPSGVLFYSEIAILAFSITGIIFAFRKSTRRPLAIFFAFYSLLLFFVYSAIAYKTPWSILCALHGLIILAGFGIATLFSITKRMWIKVALGIFVSACFLHLAVQAFWLNFKDFGPQNPYAYSQPSCEIFKLTNELTLIGKLGSPQLLEKIDIICPENGYWPLPWYLRCFENTAWYSHVDSNTPAAPLIIIDKTLEPELVKKLYSQPGRSQLYIRVFQNPVLIRPGTEVELFARADLWQQFQQALSPSP